MNTNEKGEYDDIIHLPHHVSESRPHMDLIDRAAQFAPFAALTGHADAIKKTEQMAALKVLLTEKGEKTDEYYELRD